MVFIKDISICSSVMPDCMASQALAIGRLNRYFPEEDEVESCASCLSEKNGAKACSTSLPTSKDSMQIHGPMPSRISSGRHPYPAFIFFYHFPHNIPGAAPPSPMGQPYDPLHGIAEKKGRTIRKQQGKRNP